MGSRLVDARTPARPRPRLANPLARGFIGAPRAGGITTAAAIWRRHAFTCRAEPSRATSRLSSDAAMASPTNSAERDVTTAGRQLQLESGFRFSAPPSRDLRPPHSGSSRFVHGSGQPPSRYSLAFLAPASSRSGL